MKKTTIAAIGVAGLLTAITVTGCSFASSAPTAGTPAASAPTASAPAASAPAASAPAATAPAATAAAGGVALPVAANPIVNSATAPTLAITFAGVEDLADPATGKAIDDRLILTLKNSGSTPMTGIEVYYEMTDVVTGAKEGYYQKLDGLTIPAGQDATVYFDNKTDPGHYPENQFSIYRSSTNEVDFVIQASAPGAKIATATAVKATGTGEKVD